ncbi:MAG: hypothetical protein AB1483_05635 [Candidatus Zixiibacteriota bacterium]
MDENQYSTAGWLAIVHAILFPLSIGLGFLEYGISMARHREAHLQWGISDILGIMATIAIVYVLVVFRKLLNERYNYRGIDFLITVSIWWAIIFQVVGTMITGLTVVMSPVPEILLTIVLVSFFALAMIIIGIVDILVAVRLFRAKSELNDLIIAFAVITVAAGVFEITVILSPLSLLLVPVSSVLLGVILLKEKETVEFV